MQEANGDHFEKTRERLSRAKKFENEKLEALFYEDLSQTEKKARKIIWSNMKAIPKRELLKGRKLGAKTILHVRNSARASKKETVYIGL